MMLVVGALLVLLLIGFIRGCTPSEHTTPSAPAHVCIYTHDDGKCGFYGRCSICGETYDPVNDR